MREMNPIFQLLITTKDSDFKDVTLPFVLV